MAAKQELTRFSNVLGVSTALVLAGSVLGIIIDGGGGYCVLLGLGVLLFCLWGVLNVVGRVFGFGTVNEYEQKKWKRIADYERQNGLSPIGWQIPWFGGRKLGCDIHGLFMDDGDGTRRRDV